MDPELYKMRKKREKRRWQDLLKLQEQTEEPSEDDPEQREPIPDPPKMEPAKEPGATPEVLVEKAR